MEKIPKFAEETTKENQADEAIVNVSKRSCTNALTRTASTSQEVTRFCYKQLFQLRNNRRSAGTRS